MIAILANHPQIQEKIHREIDSVLGSSEPHLEDRNEIHYLSDRIAKKNVRSVLIFENKIYLNSKRNCMFFSVNQILVHL